jgi:hypothetical protein
METGGFYVVHAEILQLRDKVSSMISAQEAVKRGPKRLKLKNLHC